jgi:SagB-type dehydrogenase family enzyme
MPLETIDLPEVRTTSAISIEAALWARRSLRTFRDETIALADLGQLLWACQGLNRPELGRRTTPSAGALYPLEVYVVTAEGIHHYVPESHQLERLSTEDVRDRIPAQSFVRPAPVVAIITAVFARTEERYGARAERYVHLEAGHAAHGLLLQAVSLGLGGTPVGSFDDEELRRLLGVPSDHEPLYVIPIGVPG